MPEINSPVCIISPHKRWIDIYCHHLLSYTPSTIAIESEQDIEDHIQMQQMQSLFSEKKAIPHLSFKKITQLKSAIKNIKTPHVFSISQLSKAQIKSIQGNDRLVIKDMQYPKRSDMQTAINMFAKSKNSTCSFTHLLKSTNDNLDEILEACERQHLLNLKPNSKQAQTATHVKGFDLLPLIYQMQPQAIANMVSHLTDEDLMVVYWQICKHFYILSLYPISTPQLMQITPWRSLHPQIKIWQRRHQRNLRQYMQMCHRIELTIKGATDLNTRNLIFDLVIKAGQAQ